MDHFDFTISAPMLQRFVCRGPLSIPQNFFAGRPAVLRHVEVDLLELPAACPALATVSHLVAGVPEGRSPEAHQIGRLFSIFPRLVSLSLRGLPEDNRRLPLMGKAPRTLSRLSLKTYYTSCDIIQYAFELAPEECKDIRLAMPAASRGQLSSLIAYALQLEIQPATHGLRDDLMPAIITLSGGRIVTLDFGSTIVPDMSEALTIAFLEGHAGLAQLRALTMPLYIFQQLFRRGPRLPSLRQICVIIQQALGKSPLDLFRLYFLALMRPYALSSCTLDVRKRATTTPPANDAQAVITYIARYGSPGVRYILRGCGSDVATIPPGLTIEFENPSQLLRSAINLRRRTVLAITDTFA